jgi:hypothetical protein
MVYSHPAIVMGMEEVGETAELASAGKKQLLQCVASFELHYAVYGKT